MIFSSIEYGIFFLITAVLYYLTPAKYRWVCLLLAGIFFYGYVKPVYVLIPALIICIAYFGGIKIENTANEKQANRYFLAAIISIVGVLVFFKYVNFFSSTIVDIINFSSLKITG